jgi:hypothetical protein
MANSIHSVQAAHAHSQAEQSVQPPKTLQTEAATQTAPPRDTVTISQDARQALASNTKRTNGTDGNSGGNH